MNAKKITILTLTVFLMTIYPLAAMDNNVINDAFARYTKEGGSNFNADTGKSRWYKKEATANKGKGGSCVSCHGENFSQEGKHVNTGKIIPPMSPRVNNKRFTSTKELEKWFQRNCNWVYDRECTAQEKGDFLAFLIKQ